MYKVLLKYEDEKRVLYFKFIIHAVGKNNVYYNIVFLSISASEIAYTVCTHNSVIVTFNKSLI